MVAAIDTVELVSRLYATYIRADSSFTKKYPAGSERHRKNYVFKFLRKSSAQILKEQFDHHNFICQELDLLNHPEKFHYYSLDADHGRFLEYLSWKEWDYVRAERKNLELQRHRLQDLLNALSPTERMVVDRVQRNCSYKKIAKDLNIKESRVRKILLAAKKKLRKELGGN